MNLRSSRIEKRTTDEGGIDDDTDAPLRAYIEKRNRKKKKRNDCYLHTLIDNDWILCLNEFNYVLMNVHELCVNAKYWWMLHVYESNVLMNVIIWYWLNATFY